MPIISTITIFLNTIKIFEIVHTIIPITTSAVVRRKFSRLSYSIVFDSLSTSDLT